MEAVVNKTMDMDDLESPAAKEVSRELDKLILEVRARGLPITSWFGLLRTRWYNAQAYRANRGYGYERLPGSADDLDFPWFLYWEIAWVWLNSGMKPGQRVLDLGGTCSLFSYFLANKGLDVTTVDLNPKLKKQADRVARAMGWQLENKIMDMREIALEPDESFDHVTSVCVFEHIRLEDRIKISGRIGDLIAPGGRFSVTFDYRSPSRLAGIDTPEDVRRQFVEPSGLSVVGNERFFDNGKDYLLHPFHSRGLGLNTRWKIAGIMHGEFPVTEILRTRDTNEYTFGALFLKK